MVLGTNSTKLSSLRGIFYWKIFLQGALSVHEYYLINNLLPFKNFKKIVVLNFQGMVPEKVTVVHTET